MTDTYPIYTKTGQTLCRIQTNFFNKSKYCKVFSDNILAFLLNHCSHIMLCIIFIQPRNSFLFIFLSLDLLFCITIDSDLCHRLINELFHCALYYTVRWLPAVMGSANLIWSSKKQMIWADEMKRARSSSKQSNLKVSVGFLLRLFCRNCRSHFIFLLN